MLVRMPPEAARNESLGESLAVAAASAGATLVVGAELVDWDVRARFTLDGKLLRWPALNHWSHAFQSAYRGLGEVLVEVDSEAIHTGVLEYLLDRGRLEGVQLRLGRVDSGLAERVECLDRALVLCDRGCTLIPDPKDPEIQAAYRDGTLKGFARQRRRGFLTQAAFLARCKTLRRLGVRRITARIEVCQLREVSLALEWANLAQLDLCVFDPVERSASVGAAASGSDSEHSMHQEAIRTAASLAERGHRVADLAWRADSGDSPNQLLESLELGRPFVKATAIEGFCSGCEGLGISASRPVPQG